LVGREALGPSLNRVEPLLNDTVDATDKRTAFIEVTHPRWSRFFETDRVARIEDVAIGHVDR
jgi:hypothetical protein